MATDKKSFLLYCDLIYTVNKLPNDKAGELFKHILAYVNDLDPETEDLITNLVFEPIKQQLKRDLKKYESIVGRNKINGSKGGRPKKPKKPTGLIGNPKEPKKADTDTVTVTDTDTVTDILLKKETKSSRFTAPTLLEIQSYVIEQNYVGFDSETFFNFYESKGWMVGKSKMKIWKAAVAGWHARNKNQKNGNSKNQSRVDKWLQADDA